MGGGSDFPRQQFHSSNKNKPGELPRGIGNHRGVFPRLVAPLRKQEDEIAINMKITEYKTAKGDSADSLDTAVNTLLLQDSSPMSLHTLSEVA